MGLDLPTNNQELDAMASRISNLTHSEQSQFLENILKLLPTESKQEWNKMLQASLQQDKQQSENPRVINVESFGQRDDPNSFTFIISDNAANGGLNHDSPDFRQFIDTLAQTVLNLFPNEHSNNLENNQALDSIETDQEQTSSTLRHLTRRARTRMVRGRQNMPYRSNRNMPFWDANNPNRDAQN